MSYGRLKVTCGPMFAGKSEALIRDILFASYFDQDGDKVGVFKPAFDTRYKKDEIVTHNGKSVRAIPLKSPDQSLVGELKEIFFDEVQFFAQPQFEGDFLEYVRALRAAGTNVHCAGLDMDFQGNSFEITGALMAESTEVNRISGICSRCGAPSTRTGRIAGSGPRVELGTSDKYEPLCISHWAEVMAK